MQIPDRFDFEFDQRVETAGLLHDLLPAALGKLRCSARCCANTLHAGMPAEYFRPDRVTMLKRRWAVESFDGYLRALIERKTSPNGVFGLKVHWGQYPDAAGDRDPSTLFAGLAPAMRFITMRREDHVRQAVSWVRALQTRSWSTVLGPEQAPPVFDRDDIERKMRPSRERRSRVGRAVRAPRHLALRAVL